MVAVRVESMARLGVRFAFPYGSGAWSNGADWDRPREHTTTVHEVAGGWQLERRLDGTQYWITIGAEDARLEQIGTHEFLPGQRLRSWSCGSGSRRERRDVPAGFAELEADCRAAWERFWESGAAVSLVGDARAVEIERRIVLSQYLTAINCAGSLPPQETGLSCNSWRGKFHLEMHWWHAAHFAAVGPARAARAQPRRGTRGSCRRRGETARAQGYGGARWPKQVGPDGRESPSEHRAVPGLAAAAPDLPGRADVARTPARRDAVERYGRDRVRERGVHGVVRREDRARVQLGPPLIPAQESYWRSGARW